MITSHTKYFGQAHPTAFWDAHFGRWESANPEPVFAVPAMVQWKELLSKLDTWFVAKSGRGFFDMVNYPRPDLRDYMTSRLFNQYKIGTL